MQKHGAPVHRSAPGGFNNALPPSSLQATEQTVIRAEAPWQKADATSAISQARGLPVMIRRQQRPSLSGYTAVPGSRSPILSNKIKADHK